MTGTDPTSELRAWAYGDNAREAATELLIRADLAGTDEPWILQDRQWGIYAVNYDAVPYGRADLTDSETAVLLLAASLANNTPVDVQTLAHDLDYDHTLLAVTAITHAAGYHHRTTGIETDSTDGSMHRIVHRPPIMNWDDNDTFGP